METNFNPESRSRVEFAWGRGDLSMVKVTTPVSTAEIYLQGAQITSFQKNGDPPLLFQSAKSFFEPGKAIRGGVPICFPWFGSRTGEPAHGFARTTEWELVGTSETLMQTPTTVEGGATLHFRLPTASLKSAWAGLRAEFIVRIADTLSLELVATNETTDKTLEIESCLHHYFHVGDIGDVSITGLQGASYLDTATDGHGARKTDNDSVLKITRETNRVYTDTSSAVEIHDAKLKRTIRMEKFNSHSTVVWNPWTTQLMVDFDPAEHKHMVCVEAGNVKKNQISLAPGASSALRATLSSGPLK